MHPNLEDVFFRHEGNLVDKWEQYLKIYSIEIERFVRSGKPVSLLEIGVQNGGSLELWGSLLPAGSRICGVDIDPRVSNIKFENPNISVHVCDGTTDKMNQLFDDYSFDILIDDGSHASKDIIASFENCFQLVKPGGVYIIEDMHVPYYEVYNYGLAKENSAVTFMNRLVDALHTDYIDQDPRSGKDDLASVRKYNRLIGRITFYDSVVVIEKLAKPKVEPYRRILSGTTSAAVNVGHWVDALPRPQLATLRLSPQAGEQIDFRLLATIERLEEEVRALRDVESARMAEFEQSNAQHRAAAETHREALETEVKALQDAQLRQTAEIARLESVIAAAEQRAAALETEAAMLRDSAEHQATLSQRLSRDLDEHKALLTREQDRAISAERRLGSANDQIATLENRMQTEISAAQRTIFEMQGKFERMHTAWSLKNMEIQNLKAARQVRT